MEFLSKKTRFQNKHWVTVDDQNVLNVEYTSYYLWKSQKYVMTIFDRL